MMIVGNCQNPVYSSTSFVLWGSISMRKRRLKQIIWYIAKRMDHHKVKIVIVKLLLKKLKTLQKLSRPHMCARFSNEILFWCYYYKRKRHYMAWLFASERFFPDTLQLALYVAFIHWRTLQFITLEYWYLNIAFVFQIRTHW